MLEAFVLTVATTMALTMYTLQSKKDYSSWGAGCVLFIQCKIPYLLGQLILSLCPMIDFCKVHISIDLCLVNSLQCSELGCIYCISRVKLYEPQSSLNL